MFKCCNKGLVEGEERRNGMLRGVEEKNGVKGRESLGMK